MNTNLQMESTNESAVIVGSGIVGIACAHYLMKHGFDVTVIDQSSIASQCSHGNLGYICPSHVLPLTEPAAIGTAIKSFFDRNAPFRVKPRLSPAFCNWMWQFARRCNRRQMLDAAAHLKSILDSSMIEYREIIREQSLDCEWHDSGLLHVLETNSGMRDFAETDKLLADQFGVEAQRIEGKDLTEFDPAFRPGLAGAFYYEGDAFVRPDLLNGRWYQNLKRNGVTFIEDCKLTTVEKKAGQIKSLQTSQGKIKADRFVFATGAWSTQLSSHLGCRIPVEPGKGYSITMKRPDLCPKYPMLFPEHNVGVTPFDRGYRLGSMMEFVGFDTSIPERRIRQLRKSAQPYLVEPFTEEIQETWYGWRPMTWDSLPIIGQVPRLDNAYLATGHNMLGLSLAAATGKLIVEIIQDKPTHIDSSAFSPERF
ncbi:MAG: FAD-dependent oxidoreductase [Woeseia sp.]|jgi:D-amino-acid dehydrogenase|nr:FAD-dependent oxidoreductase [Woeseia sp.]